MDNYSVALPKNIRLPCTTKCRYHYCVRPGLPTGNLPGRYTGGSICFGSGPAAGVITRNNGGV